MRSALLMISSMSKSVCETPRRIPADFTIRNTRVEASGIGPFNAWLMIGLHVEIIYSNVAMNKNSVCSGLDDIGLQNGNTHK